ncbi:hypothetical protein [Paraburkholderia ultramafica]|uniref:hypothetical protein n=1 Tax=Paraburkholderia ultramafica TaxID=1544867 RepID=UPI00158171DF|nr:hypothetical protein [Paraburkholderia ultramafica]
MLHPQGRRAARHDGGSGAPGARCFAKAYLAGRFWLLSGGRAGLLDMTPGGRGTDWYPKLEYASTPR